MFSPFSYRLFARAVGESSNSLVGNANLISKVYFPRLAVPLSSLAVGLIDFLIGLPVLAVLMIVYGVAPGWQLLFLPLFIALALAAAFGLGLWLCALNVRYRDVRYVIPFIVQFGLFLSPVGFSSSIVPPGWRWLFALNPMAGVIEGVRWSLFGTPPPFAEPGFAVSLALTALSCVWRERSDSYRASMEAFSSASRSYTWDDMAERIVRLIEG